MSHSLTFLGTASGCGVPAFFCHCAACEEARENPACRRGCCGILLEGDGGKRMLIDTPPDLRQQLIREKVDTIDNLMYTHAHFDHLGGLGELEYFVRLNRDAPLDMYASAPALDGISTEFHYMMDCFETHVLEPFERLEFDGISYEALPVAHAEGTYGYLIKSPSTTIFYASDTARLSPETAEKVRGVDILIMDATFWKSNWRPDAHHSVQETIDEGFELDAKRIYLTHLAMHYSEAVTVRELEDFLMRYEGRVVLPHDGLKLEF
jgi:phosphoribosyl 1,2-cyclic phosphate phosphodiesterase